MLGAKAPMHPHARPCEPALPSQEVGFNGPLCCLSFLAEDMLKSSMEAKLPTQWTSSMMRRECRAALDGPRALCTLCPHQFRAC